MQRWVLVVVQVLVLVTVDADFCTDGGRCDEGQTCCSSPGDGYQCCPLEQAKCCDDHVHCCPMGTVCDTASSSCVNVTTSVPWVQQTAGDRPIQSKSFRMIRTYQGDDEDNMCPDQSRCPSEFSCVKGLTKFGCCPLVQGVPCADGKHCCPENHFCSADSRSCIKETVTTVLCSDGKSECPDETTCCETAEGGWGCCLMPQAVCCDDKVHCCPEGYTCDVQQYSCQHRLTNKRVPMWAKFSARIRAKWEDQKDKPVTAELSDGAVTGSTPQITTANGDPPSEAVSSVSGEAAGDVLCNATFSCPEDNTCCEAKEGGWSCCPLPQAVCCDDFEHCCPEGTTCNLPLQTCDSESSSIPWTQKIQKIQTNIQVKNVMCDDTMYCPDDTTCCKTEEGTWACCPLPEAVCCDDHEHCCPYGTTCDPTSTSCDGPSGSTPVTRKTPAFTMTTSTTMETSTQTQETNPIQEEENEEPREEPEEEGSIQLGSETTCPPDTTSCYMASSKKCGCCPLPDAVCCPDGLHCCPNKYKCDQNSKLCIKGDVVIPWYTKIPATVGIQANPSSVNCDGAHQCPEHTTCCRLFTGEQLCCPLRHAVCCHDQKHCCPLGYSCHAASSSCKKLIRMQVDSIPLTQVFLPEPPSALTDIKCDDETYCGDEETCCRTSSTTWGCCPFPNAVCCPDMIHCCPSGYSCNGGSCVQNSGLHWFTWNIFFANRKRALIV